MKTRRKLATSLFLAGVLAACGDLTSGGYGNVEVVVASDPVTTAQESAAPLAPSFQLGDAGGAAEGSVRLRTRVYLRTGARSWLELTEGVQEITVSLHQGEEKPLAGVRIPAGRYDGVRVDVTFVQAEIDRGLHIQGDSVSGPIAVTIPGGGLSLLFDEEVDVTEGSDISILVQLRAQEWLRKADRIGRLVAAEDFTDEVRLEVRR